RTALAGATRPCPVRPAWRGPCPSVGLAIRLGSSIVSDVKTTRNPVLRGLAGRSPRHASSGLERATRGGYPERLSVGWVERSEAHRPPLSAAARAQRGPPYIFKIHLKWLLTCPLASSPCSSRTTS